MRKIDQEGALALECAALGTALVDGIFQTPLWDSFLGRLRQTMAADYAIMLLRSPGRPFLEATQLLSGDASFSETDEVYRKFFHPLDPPPHRLLEEGRPYSMQEMLGPDGGQHSEFFHYILLQRGIAGMRQMRVREPSGIDMWLTIARRGIDFADRDTMLLSELAPMLRGVLRTYVALERERYAGAITGETVRRLQYGWITLDRSGHVLDFDIQGGATLAGSGIIGKNGHGRLTSPSPELERELHDAIIEVADHPLGRPRTIQLARDPWLDMLLLPARRRSVSAKIPPAVIAYLHGEGLPAIDRCEQLAELFALSPNEARLALAFSRGMTIAEAADELNLRLETVRSYSKIIYAKTGARGLPDLVRIILRSALAIASDGESQGPADHPVVQLTKASHTIASRKG